jgi:tRNA G46 methylase TrmB
MSSGSHVPDVSELKAALTEHLIWWGLRRFESDDAYFRWQRETLDTKTLTLLNRLAEERRVSKTAAAEVAFYDSTARPNILPVLYSQRYGYYLAVGPPVVERIARAQPAGGQGRSLLDFGCGIGILTTFYARAFPDLAVVGVDRSPDSLAVARERAEALGLRNIRFECLDVQQKSLDGAYALIACTHALMQSEQDPGIPSVSWQTFERARDPAVQRDFEARTGLGERLDRLNSALAPDGRLMVFEKTRQLARRVPIQRAFEARGLRLLEPPLPIRYSVVEETSDDGPLYVLGRASYEAEARSGWAYDEAPELAEEDELYRCRGETARLVRRQLPDRAVARSTQWTVPEVGVVRAEWGQSGSAFADLFITVADGFTGILVGRQGAGMELDCRVGRAFTEMAGGRRDDSRRLVSLIEDAWPPASMETDPTHAPLYENHTASAQETWARLPGKAMLRSSNYSDPRGGQTYVEMGTTAGLMYLYQADTFDHRQIVVVESRRAALLEQYYQELTAS